jgi:hypothetical protein
MVQGVDIVGGCIVDCDPATGKVPRMDDFDLVESSVV